MVQTSPKHQENPLEYFIYRPLLQIMTNRPPCRGTSDLYSTALEICYMIATRIFKLDKFALL